MKNEESHRINIHFCGITLFFLGVFAVLIYSPKQGFHQGHDMNSSAYGMALSRSYLESFEANEAYKGFPKNGGYAYYFNWSPWVFQVFAAWFKFTKDDSIFNARIFTAIIYGISCLIFYLFLVKNCIQPRIAFFSTLLFLTLPIHLKFANLIFADIWLIPFWLTSLFFYQSKRKYTTILFTLTVLVGTLFMWFTIFLLPAAVLFHFWKELKNPSFKKLLLSTSITILLIWSVQALLVYETTDYRFYSLQKWTVFGFFETTPYSYKNIVREVFWLLLECSSILFFILFLYRKKNTAPLSYSPRSENSPLDNLIILLSLTMVLFAFSVPIWLIHMKAIAFLSITLGFVFVKMLSSKNTRYRIRSIHLTMILFFINLIGIGFIEVFYQIKGKERIEAYRDVIQKLEGQSHPDYKLAVFYLYGDNQKPLFHPFAVTTQTRNYFVDCNEMGYTNINQCIADGLNNLNKNGFSDYNREKVILISDKTADSDINIIESQSIENLNFYAIKTN